jgi:biopolymer transport protein ExbD
MNLNQVKLLAAPALASLLMILIVCALVDRHPASVGFFIPMIRLQHNPDEPTDCGGRAEFLRLTKDGRTWINDDEIPAGRIATNVAALIENRAERVVYVVVDSDLTFGQFAHFVDRIAGSTSDLHIVVVSGEVRRAFERDRDLCDLHYSAKY